MKIAYITAGAAGTICGNCLQDNAVAAALKRNGHDVVLLPAYTPLRTDEPDVSDRRVVFGGINLHLQGHYGPCSGLPEYWIALSTIRECSAGFQDSRWIRNQPSSDR